MALTPVQKRLQEERKKRARKTTTTDKGTLVELGEGAQPETTRQVFFPNQKKVTETDKAQEIQEQKVPTLTPEELKIRQESQAIVEEREEELAGIKEQQEQSLRDSVEAAKQQAQIQKQQQEQQLDIAQRQAQAASTGLGAFGATTAAGRALGAGLQQQVGRAQTVAEFNIQQIDEQLAQKQRQVQEFFAKKDKASAQKALDTLAEVEELRIQRQREELAIGAEAESNLEQAQQQVNSFLDNIGMEQLALLDAEGITNLVNSQAGLLGLPEVQTGELLKTALAKQAIAKQLQTATPEQQQGLLGLFNSLGISPTRGVQQAGAIQALQSQLASGDITEDEFERLSQIVTETTLTEKERAETERIRAQAAQINEKLSPTSAARSLNLSEVSTGEPLQLGRLGDPLQVSRADRHNNPVASKAYASTLDILRRSGLQEGIDFNVGETTKGIDSDGVATVVFSSPESGVRGAIATLEAGQLGSWYVQPKYSGSNRVLNAIAEQSGRVATQSNAQELFNTMTSGQQTEVVKAIYAHEGGNQLFRPVETPELVPKFENNEQSKAFTFAKRMLESDQILKELEGVDFENDTDEFLVETKLGGFLDKGFGVPNLPFIASSEELIPNAMLSDKEQAFNQARRNFITAILRKESGAAIAASEFKEANRTYFPQPGDSKDTLEQKRQTRKTVIESLFQESQNPEFLEIELAKINARKLEEERSIDLDSIVEETGLLVNPRSQTHQDVKF